MESSKIAYEEVEVGERPFVLVHGFTSSRNDFADVLEPICTLVRTPVPDLRGHGDTSNPGEGDSLDQPSNGLAGTLDATGANNCELLGHSLGGMVALRLAIMEHNRIASLILMDTGARAHMRMPDSVSSLIKWITQYIPASWQWHALKASRRRLPEPAHRAAERMGFERHWRKIRMKLEAMDLIAFSQFIYVFTRQRTVDDRLHEIRCPTLVLTGDQDEAFLEPNREMAKGIPGARLIVIKDAHNNPQSKARDAWLSEIRTHLKRVPA